MLSLTQQHQTTKMINLVVYTAIFLLFACKTAPKKSEDPNNNPVFNRSNTSVENNTPITCDLPTTQYPCTSNESVPQNSKCMIDTYDNKRLTSGNLIHSWGISVCNAKQNLKTKVCDSGKKHELIGLIICSTISNLSECPIKTIICPSDFSPVSCRLSKYNGKDLPSAESKIKTWGSNTCDAKVKLKTTLCELGLKPSLSENGIECSSDGLYEECPSKELSCPDENIPSTCRAERSNNLELIEPITSSGRNECEARVSLHNQACNKGISPKSLTEIKCTSFPE